MACSDPFNLPKIEFIGGSSQTIKFHLKNKLGGEFDARDCTAEFAILHYYDRTEVTLKNPTMTLGTGATRMISVATVELQPDDTVDLSGRYIYQISIRNPHGEHDIPGQGLMDITKNINPDFVSG